MSESERLMMIVQDCMRFLIYLGIKHQDFECQDSMAKPKP